VITTGPALIAARHTVWPETKGIDP
jgi:hypothetical protein